MKIVDQFRIIEWKCPYFTSFILSSFHFSSSTFSSLWLSSHFRSKAKPNYKMAESTKIRFEIVSFFESFPLIPLLVFFLYSASFFESFFVCSLQKSCIDFAINARPFATYIPPMHKHFKYKIWSMVVSQPFDNFIMLLIVLNTLLLMSKVQISNSNQNSMDWY